jgi:predicted enzyme related to lactoylglutathione lyase
MAYITVKDVDAVAKKAEEMGGTIVVAPTDIEKVGRFCTIQDPEGAVFSVIQYAEGT